MSYRIGDEIICKLNEGTLDHPIGVEFKLQIIGFGNGNDGDVLFCYVPSAFVVKNSFLLSERHKRHYGFDRKFIGEYGAFVGKHEVITHIPCLDGQTCCLCGEFVWMASDKIQFTCRHCVENPLRRFY